MRIDIPESMIREIKRFSHNKNTSLRQELLSALKQGILLEKSMRKDILALETEQERSYLREFENSNRKVIGCV